MITRDWNHPSIVIWGVRINESHDDHDFYAETNRVAHELDGTRQTGGVRYITDSEMLEDVYTMNDFILGNEELGGNRPRTALRPISETTGLERPVPYMITEFGGHMYPTKSHDQEQRQAEHVRRHLEVLNAAYGNPGISGAIGWCAFDYNTHKDFGSGDRICHHGVMDMFREPKFAAYAYASQCEPDEEVILQPVTFWARGERNIGGVLPLMVLTNCDAVEIRYGDDVVKRVGPDREQFPHLPHAPVVLDRRHFSAEELGLWGMEWHGATITGFVGGKPVKTVRYVADPVATTLQVVADATAIGATDAVRVMVRALDQAGNKLPFFPEPVTISVSGPGRLLGPKTVPLRAGSTGFWVQAEGAGSIEVTVASDRLGTQRVAITAG
jgi:beta-galactosidase